MWAAFMIGFLDLEWGRCPRRLLVSREKKSQFATFIKSVPS
jgi:hypothetical protein